MNLHKSTSKRVESDNYVEIGVFGMKIIKSNRNKYIL